MTPVLLTSLAVLLRIFSNPLGNVLQKKLTVRGHHPLIVNFISYLLLAILCLLLILPFQSLSLSKEFWLYSLIGGVLGALGNGFLVKALQSGDLSVLGPINSYKSVVGLLFGIFLLGELPNVWGVGGIALIVLGSYFVLDTTNERFSWALLKRREIQFRLWAMVLTAIEAVFIKKIILASSTTMAFVSWCVFGAFFSFLLVMIYRVDIRKQARGVTPSVLPVYLLLIGCIGTMQYTTNYVFDYMPVGYALSLFQLSTILSVIFGYRIFKEQDIRKKLLGSIIMIAGSVVIIWMK